MNVPDPRKKRRGRAIGAPLLASARLSSDRAGRFAIEHGCESKMPRGARTEPARLSGTVDLG
jgi:hypothetical protein